MSDIQTKLFTEHVELSDRIKRLEKFILGDTFETLPDIEKESLREQLKHMRGYCHVLSMRVSRRCGNA